MAKRLVTVSVALVVFCGPAFGRTSYPQLAGELGFSVAHHDMAIDVGVTSLEYTSYFPRVDLDGTAPTELQTWAQRASHVTLGLSRSTFGAPTHSSRRAFFVSASDFAGKNLGLTASYATGYMDIAAPDVTGYDFWSFGDAPVSSLSADTVMSIGVLVDHYPGHVFRADVTLSEYAEQDATNNWESLSVALGSMRGEAGRLWVEAGIGVTSGNAWGDDTNMHAAAMLYKSDEFGFGASLSGKLEDSDLMAAVALRAAWSKETYRLELSGMMDFDDPADLSIGLRAAYRF